MRNRVNCCRRCRTKLLRALAARGYPVIEEAATDVINAPAARGVDEPWTGDDYCDRIVALQRRRQIAPVPGTVDVQIYDRSPLCTLALARFLRRPLTPLLSEQVVRGRARADLPAAVYREHGYELVNVPAGPVIDRADLVHSIIERGTADHLE